MKIDPKLAAAGLGIVVAVITGGLLVVRAIDSLIENDWDFDFDYDPMSIFDEDAEH